MSYQLVINKKMMRYFMLLFFFNSFPISGVMLEIMKNLHNEDRYELWLAAYAAAVAAQSLQSCLTLCKPRDGSPPGSPVPGILQARTLE